MRRARSALARRSTWRLRASKRSAEVGSRPPIRPRYTRYIGSLPAAADFVIVAIVIIVVTVRHHAETARNGRLTYVSTLVNAGQQKERALPAGVGDGVTQALNGGTLPTDAAHRLALCESDSLPALCRAAAELRDRGKGRIVTFSPKVFIPLTRLCRDFCGYCTFRQSPLESESLFMTIEEVVAVAKAGKQAGCTEALFTLGERLGFRLKPRLPVYPELVTGDGRLIPNELRDRIRAHADDEGYVSGGIERYAPSE